METLAVRLEAGFNWTAYSLTMYQTAIAGAVQNVNSLVSFLLKVLEQVFWGVQLSRHSRT